MSPPANAWRLNPQGSFTLLGKLICIASPPQISNFASTRGENHENHSSCYNTFSSPDRWIESDACELNVHELRWAQKSNPESGLEKFGERSYED